MPSHNSSWSSRRQLSFEPHPRYSRAARHEIENALDEAVATVRVRWPLERSTPPPLLWEHTLQAGARLALKALTLDERFQPGTRTWTELGFGQVDQDLSSVGLPWDPHAEIRIPGTSVRVCGRIDRLDLNVTGDAVRVSDYKTRAERKGAAEIVLSGGAELQRVIYAVAASQLVPDSRRIVARLVFLGDDKLRPYRLPDVEKAIKEMASHVTAACALLEQGTALPEPDASERWNGFRLALPAAAATYFSLKHSAFERAFGGFSRVWRCQ